MMHRRVREEEIIQGTKTTTVPLVMCVIWGKAGNASKTEKNTKMLQRGIKFQECNVFDTQLSGGNFTDLRQFK